MSASLPILQQQPLIRMESFTGKRSVVAYPQAIDDGIDSIRIALDPFNIICVGLELSGRPVFLFAQKDSHSIQNLDCISILDATCGYRKFRPR